MAKKRTLQDVARLAGVSAATVSRVVTGASKVNADLADRVRKAADQLGVNLNRKSKPSVVGFLLSNREMLHPFHSRLLVGAESYCSEHGYNLLYLSYRYEARVPWRELHVPGIFEQRDLICGFIVAGANYQNLLELLSSRQVPLAILGNNVVGEWNESDHDVVWFDDVRGSFDLTQYLIQLGHRHIWYVGNQRLPWFVRRYAGYCRAMAEAGLVARLSDVDSSRDFEIGYLGTKSLLSRKEPVSAIIAGGDPTAQGVYTALRDLKLKIPDDISVGGFNDIEAPMLHPPLTTVRAYPEQVGSRLAQLLLERVEQQDTLPFRREVVPTQLVKRESCLPLFQSADSPSPSFAAAIGSQGTDEGEHKST
ncbi:MAG: LacI family DNA-binding transcriptional regulator [Acidobacteriota bacterium]